MLENLRIHFLGIRTRHDWILASLDYSRADKVYLFRKKNEDYKPAKDTEKEIIKFLKKKKIPYKLMEYQEKEIFNLLKKIRETIEKEKDNYIYLNISSGQRVIHTSFAISSLLFKSIAKDLRLYSMEGGDFNKLPCFEVRLPEKELIEAMKFINKNNNECRKKELKKYVFENDIIKVDKDTESNKYMKLNRSIVDKLVQWNFIEVEGKGKGAVIKLREDGQNLIKFL